jgi:hypothetical protein
MYLRIGGSLYLIGGGLVRSRPTLRARATT